MFCRGCGMEVDPGDLFCRHCGQWVAPDTQAEAPSQHAPRPNGVPAKGRRVQAVIVVLLLLAVGSGVAVLYGGTFDDGIERTFTVGDTTVTDDLTADIFQTAVGGTVSYVGGDEQVTWYYKDNSGTAFVRNHDGTYVERGYTEHVGQELRFSEPGDYGVVVDIGDRTYTGDVVVDGTIDCKYRWNYRQGSMMYSMEFDYRFDFLEYKQYHDMDLRRWIYTNEGADYSRKFIIVDDSISRLSEALAEEYRETFGNGASLAGQDYTDYILSFVQCVIAYPDPIAKSGDTYIRSDSGGNGDMFLNGCTEYWAFPMETIYTGYGDCEDTSILACALLSASGIPSTVLILPGHMMSGVLLDSFSPRQGVAGTGLVEYSSDVTYKDKRYVFCPAETTFNTSVPVGYIGRDYYSNVQSMNTIEVIAPISAE